MRTKWDIMQERRTKAWETYKDLDAELTGLENTPCNLKCGTCGALHETEADFAKHYLVTDERYVNLGFCPTRFNDGKLMPRMSEHMYNEAYWENEEYDLKTRVNDYGETVADDEESDHG